MHGSWRLIRLFKVLLKSSSVVGVDMLRDEKSMNLIENTSKDYHERAAFLHRRHDFAEQLE